MNTPAYRPGFQPTFRPTVPPLARPRTPQALLAAQPLTSRPIYQQYIPPKTAPFSASSAGESSRLPQITADDADFFSQFEKTTGYVRPPVSAPPHWSTAPTARADNSGSVPPVAIPAAPSTFRPVAMADESGGQKGVVTSRTFVVVEKKSRGPWAMMMVAFGCAVGILGSMAVLKYKAAHAAAPAMQEPVAVAVAAPPPVVMATPVSVQPTIVAPPVFAPPPVAAAPQAPQSMFAGTGVNANNAKQEQASSKSDAKDAKDAKTASKNEKGAEKTKTTKVAKATWTAPKSNPTPPANVTVTKTTAPAPTPKADASADAMLKAAQRETGNSL